MNTRRRIRFTSILSLATACLMLPPARAAATTILHNFIGNSDGWTPWGSLTLSGSTLYGMTNRGGSSGDRGTVFRVNTDGTGYAKLRTFTGGASDGSYPYGSLTLSGSKLYGMTGSGGSVNWGTIFSINTDGTGFGLLHTFADTLRNGGITPRLAEALRLEALWHGCPRRHRWRWLGLQHEYRWHRLQPASRRRWI